MDGMLSTESPAGEASHQSFSPPLTCVTQTSDSEPQAPATRAYGIRNRCPPHHWMLGPPRYNLLSTIEYTDWTCRDCGTRRKHVFEIPFQESSNEDATRRRQRYEDDD